jgi:hypothetical protein
MSQAMPSGHIPTQPAEAAAVGEALARFARQFAD